MKRSIMFLAFLNLLTLVFSIVMISFGAKGMRNVKNNSYGCDDLFLIPLLWFGIFFMVIAILGVIGACGQFSKILLAYQVMMLIILIAYGLFHISSFFILWNGGSDTIDSVGDYKLSGNSKILQNRVKDQKNWNRIKTCLQKDACSSLSQKGKLSFNDYNKLKKDELTPIVIGCCTPSMQCGFIYENPTVWKKTNGTSSSASSDPGCKAWENDPKVLCFNCEKCKAGVLMAMRGIIRSTRVWQLLFLCFLLALYIVGSHSYKHIKVA